MKQSMINYMQQEKNDNLFTPISAILPLLNYLPGGKQVVWECCDPGNSKITQVLTAEMKYDIISTDIVTGTNFLTYEPDFYFDMIITNPPYSLKNEFLEKCYGYGKPFALLLPLTALEGIDRGKLFNRYGISVIVLDKRNDFTGKKQNWFNTSWFTWKIVTDEEEVGSTLVFEEN